MTATLSGAEMVVQSLIEESVEQIFGYPGGSVLDIYDALHAKTDQIKHVLVRHEQAATHMADGYARATGKPGVVLVCSGPGATNTITGIATAYMDSIPMIVISGNVPNNLIGNDAFQECDIVGVSRPVVKHSFLVKKVEDTLDINKMTVSQLKAQCKKENLTGYKKMKKQSLIDLRVFSVLLGFGLSLSFSALI